MLNQHDINELLTTLAATQANEGGKGAAYAEVKLYDFARPDNIPSEFLQALETINVAFARNLSNIISRDYSLAAQVDALSVDQLSFRQFCNSVPEISAVCTYTLSPLDGMGLLELNPHLAWYLLDRGLGGQGEIIETPRAFTSLARGLLDDLFRRMLRELTRSWETLFPLQPKLREVFSNPSMARVSQPEDRMLVCSFSITLPALTGACTYAIPIYNLNFDRIMNQDGVESMISAAGDPEFQFRQVLHTLYQAPLTLRVCLSDSQISLQELSALHIGDIIPLVDASDDPIELRVENTRQFAARAIAVDDRVAIEILHNWLEAKDE